MARIKATYSNFTELESEFNWIFRNVQELVLKEMLGYLHMRINEDVYSKSAFTNSSHNKNTWYHRTKDLMKIFKITKPYVSHGKIYGSIDIDRGKLTWNSSLGQHTTPTRATFGGKSSNSLSRLGSGRLGADALVKIINDGLDDSSSLFGEIEARPFWDNFLKWSNENYNRLFAKYFKEYAGVIANGQNLGNY